MTQDLRYPVGKYERPLSIASSDLASWKEAVQQFPALLAKELSGLNEEALDWHYRPGGWNIRQVVHHCADSHANAFIRFKLALSEDKPTIKPYHEDLWAMQADARMPIGPSVQIIEGVHARWVFLMEQMTPSEWARTFIHPEHGRELALQEVLALYAWHCRHHLAHVVQAKEHRFSA